MKTGTACAEFFFGRTPTAGFKR